MEHQSWTAEDISDGGERVSHLAKDFFYYGHLSIYDFAIPYCSGAVVLDVGCGAGYGSAFLASHGARHVSGVDASAKAVEFCRDHFAADNLTYSQMSAERLTGFPPHNFDLIFTSNALEHVPNVKDFLHTAWTLLKPDGRLLIAVPPITNDQLLYLNVMNPYHVNLWSPRQWYFAIGQYFDQVTPILHGVETIGGEPRPEHLAAQPALDEKTFKFAAGTVEDMYRIFTLTTIFVAARPRAAEDCPRATDPVTFIDDSFSRPEGYIDPGLRRRLRPYFSTEEDRPPSRLHRAGLILKTHGPRELLKEVTQFVRWSRRRQS
jgi:SAM-dependent methyltransferase